MGLALEEQQQHECARCIPLIIKTCMDTVNLRGHLRAAEDVLHRMRATLRLSRLHFPVGRDAVGIVDDRTRQRLDRATQQWIIGLRHPLVQFAAHFAERRRACRIVDQIVVLGGVEEKIVQALPGRPLHRARRAQGQNAKPSRQAPRSLKIHGATDPAIHSPCKAWNSLRSCFCVLPRTMQSLHRIALLAYRCRDKDTPALERSVSLCWLCGRASTCFSLPLPLHHARRCIGKGWLERLSLLKPAVAMATKSFNF